MIKPIIRDVFFLSQKSDPATKADLQIGIDLQDTLQANADRCVGMAASMIGMKKRVTAMPNETECEWIATAPNGWHAVKIGSQVGWVSGKYCDTNSHLKS